MASARLMTFLCFVAHLLLQAAAVPHFHEAVGDMPAHEHQGRPHVHIGGHGRHHEDACIGHHHAAQPSHHARQESAPEADAPVGGEIAAPASCCCHDDDAIDVSIDTLLANPDRRTSGLDSDHAAPFGLPAFVTNVRFSTPPACHGGGTLRPPGDRICAAHDLLPHVLRI